jgi:hypothetical protein
MENTMGGGILTLMTSHGCRVFVRRNGRLFDRQRLLRIDVPVQSKRDEEKNVFRLQTTKPNPTVIVQFHLPQVLPDI